MLVKAATLARASNKSRAYISQETNEKGRLNKNPDGLYDTNDPANKSWIISKGIRLSDLKDGRKEKLNKSESKPKVETKTEKEKEENPKSKPSSENKEEKSKTKSDLSKTKTKEQKIIEALKSKKNLDEPLPENDFEYVMGLPNKLMNARLCDLMENYGSWPGIKNWAETLDKTMSAQKKTVDVQRARGELIERDFVRSHVYDILNVLSNQLFDYADGDAKMRREVEKIIQHTKRNLIDQLKRQARIHQVAETGGVENADA